MKSRKLKPVKPGSCKKKVSSDVSPSTSLPPLVEGQLRCFLCVTISRMLWTVQKVPSPTFVRLRWWGESSDGTHFFPRDGSQLSQKNIKTTSYFPVRCGPKQLTSYLTDMGSLMLEVLTKSDHLPVARAQVPGISHLSLSQPVSGFYTLVSPTSEKLGELQVSLSLEPLMEAYENSSSGPTANTSIDGLQHRSKSAGSGKESAGSSGGNTPRGKDHLYFQNIQKHTEENLTPALNKPQTETVGIPSNQEPSHEQRSSDIISVVLERGNKLRNAMAMSALNCDVDSSTALSDTPLPLLKDNTGMSNKLSPSTSAALLQDILHMDSAQKATDEAAECGLSCPTDIDKRVVDLLLGSSITSPLPLLDFQGSSPESLSAHSSVCEENNPLYDQSLLENLFYKVPNSDTTLDDNEEESHGRNVSKNHRKHLEQIGPENTSGPNSGHRQSSGLAGVHPSLNEARSSLLSSMRLVRVSVDSLTVGPSNASPRKIPHKGKPPRPLTSKKCTYFVEYVFPTTSMSNQDNRSKARDVEVTRAASSNVKGGAVKFQQISVFPVHFDPVTLKLWKETELKFRIYSRNYNQKKPVAVGEAVYPMRNLLQSSQLRHSVVLPVQNMQRNVGNQEISHLKVSLELGRHSRDFLSEKKKNLSWTDTSKLSPSPVRKNPSQNEETNKKASSPRFLEVSRFNEQTSPQKPPKETSSHPGVQASPPEPWLQKEEPMVLLHTLLMVPDGKNFSCGTLQTPNFYLNCKLFWCDETARSVVSWSQTNPKFNFAQVTPVTLTPKLLERMKNNVMVIEVWQKVGSSVEDQLLGLVKLPLHQFYMSFRDPTITQLLLQAQFPVLGVDCYMPVIDVFSGSCKGNLRVVLAMGRSEQIVSLQRARDEENGSLSHLTRPVHLLDLQPHSHSKVKTAPMEILREHVFVIRVEKVSGLTPVQSTVWGEADCYIQYTFPHQKGLPSNLDQSLIESSVDLKPFRTTTTLCIPDPVFGHTETHVLLAPEAVPVQKLLLSSLSSQSLSRGGGIQFEVWCRYYYPNVRDQLVARGMLPLSKLCAMVTMQKQHPDEPQMFSLPLIPRTGGSSAFPSQSSGLLDVCVHYKHRPMRSGGRAGRGAPSQSVMLVVKVYRACGLKAAARLISEQDDCFSHFITTGMNPFVSVQLSFLPESEKQCSRSASRTFCPEFDLHMEAPCDLLLHMSGGETCSLAEHLEEATAVFTVWNRDNSKVNSHASKDVMLGTVKIPLVDLIHKRTGISGWFGLYQTLERSPSQHQNILVGGLQISISFAHHSDRERVVKAALGLGWEIPHHVVQDDQESWEETRPFSLTFLFPKAWIPVQCLLLPGLGELQRSTYCYFRYKFYDQEAFCSELKHPHVEEDEEVPATVLFEGGRTLELQFTQPLLWYLREEKLEVQVWVTFTKDKSRRPSDLDRLVGSAFVDLSSLTKSLKEKQTLSGVYPLFVRSAADLQGAALRVHITLAAGSAPAEEDAHIDSESQEELILEEEEEPDQEPSPRSPRRSLTQKGHKNKSFRTTPDITSGQHTETSIEDSFPVTVSVDRAMHLNLKGCPLAEKTEGTPCCCVSYITADSAEPVTTAVVANADSPVWDHQHECRLGNDLLTDPQQSLVFKVWHKGEMERVIGFASVDLSPLLCGFPSVCGWYNITDFSGQCHGQLKVSITPLRGVQELRAQRRTAEEEASKKSPTLFHTVPLSYQTTAVYSSFPSHISRYPEQKISSPKHTNHLFSERVSESDRHHEHMDKVRLYHQSLQEQTSQSIYSSSASDPNPSSSLLFSTLRYRHALCSQKLKRHIRDPTMSWVYRKKLSELDNIQRYFNRKLSTPTFPPMAEQEDPDQPEEQKDLEADTSQLLHKSNQLLGEVSSIISGLGGRHLETINFNTQGHSGSLGVEMGVESSGPPVIPESISSPTRITDDPLDMMSPSQSLPMSEDNSDSEPEEELNRRNTELCMSEEEHEEEAGLMHDEEIDDEEEDFEEVVVKPRPLNEVTSVTDKTSPWTSILSDPDLVSVESFETPQRSDVSEDEDEESQAAAPDSSGKQEESDRSPAGDERSPAGETENGLHKNHTNSVPHTSAQRSSDTPQQEDSPLQPYPSSLLTIFCTFQDFMCFNIYLYDVLYLSSLTFQ
ncbi:C2 domain-containing protein 3 [Oryzias melastigma]|uniref:C2 domain-containing protein 3 n=1 Tax=Oryzias melastigma TaxID=30732 RepID=A0A834C8Y4_ORYME|nr:C2 domain-containing protein 3 [Oryzias melastigma]